MKTLKKIELRNYKVLDSGQMKQVKGGDDKKNSDYVNCLDYKSKETCSGKCLISYESEGYSRTAVGTCTWPEASGLLQICGCVED